MAFFTSAITILQTLVVALGAGLAVWGVINLLEGYGNDNPGANWSGFFDAGYFLEFDAASRGNIKAFQLEIKDDIRNKVIDKTMTVSEKGEHFQIWLPSTTRDLTSWRKISQVCFTVFFNAAYVSGEKGILTIENLKMRPKK